MKGKRTLIFNAVMLVAGIVGENLTPEMADQYVEAFLAVWAAGNAVLRWVTTTPIFERGSP